MGVCVGGSWCREQKCKERCKSWFSSQPDLERACKNACKSNISFSKEDFLCSGKYVDDAQVIGAYYYDPCPDSGISMEDYLDPLGDREAEKEKLQNLQPAILGGGLLVLAALIVLIVVIRK